MGIFLKEEEGLREKAASLSEKELQVELLVKTDLLVRSLEQQKTYQKQIKTYLQFFFWVTIVCLVGYAVYIVLDGVNA